MVAVGPEPKLESHDSGGERCDCLDGIYRRTRNLMYPGGSLSRGCTSQ